MQGAAQLKSGQCHSWGHQRQDRAAPSVQVGGKQELWAWATRRGVWKHAVQGGGNDKKAGQGVRGVGGGGVQGAAQLTQC